jgi:hypothetical protein
VPADLGEHAHLHDAATYGRYLRLQAAQALFDKNGSNISRFIRRRERVEGGREGESKGGREGRRRERREGRRDGYTRGGPRERKEGGKRSAKGA